MSDSLDKQPIDDRSRDQLAKTKTATTGVADSAPESVADLATPSAESSTATLQAPRYDNWVTMIRAMIASQAISLLGSAIVQFALIWHITLETGSGTLIGLAMACAFSPALIFSPIAGVMADRLPRRAIIIGSDACVAAATCVLAAAMAWGYSSVALLMVILLIRGTGQAIQQPSVLAVTPDIVPSDKLMKYNGINSSFNATSNFVAPVIAGILVAVLPLPAILMIDVVTAVIGIGIFATFVRIRHIAKPQSERSHPVKDFVDGVRYVTHHDYFGRVLLYNMVMVIVFDPLVVLYNLQVVRQFGQDSFYLAVAETAFALGMIIGSLLMSQWRPFALELHTYLAGCAVMAATAIGLALAPNFMVYSIVTLLCGVSLGAINIPMVTMIQRTCASEMIGRLMSLLVMMSSAILPLSSLIWGPVADWVDVRYVIAGSGVALLVIVIIEAFDKTWAKIPRPGNGASAGVGDQ